jgi:hypothetical protein
MHSHYDHTVADGKRAVAINPNYAEGYQALADTLINYGDPEVAIRAAQEVAGMYWSVVVTLISFPSRQ